VVHFVITVGVDFARVWVEVLCIGSIDVDTFASAGRLRKVIMSMYAASLCELFHARYEKVGRVRCIANVKDSHAFCALRRCILTNLWMTCTSLKEYFSNCSECYLHYQMPISHRLKHSADKETGSLPSHLTLTSLILTSPFHLIYQSTHHSTPTVHKYR
jgi:hypothetical protein